MKVRQLFFSSIAMLLLFVQSAWANSNAEAFKEGVNYISVKPPLVVNYGAGGGRVRYIKAEISLRVEDAKSAEEVVHHMPLIRDTLIMLFSSMTDEQVGSGQGKEEMRLQALKRVNDALEKMEHPAKAEVAKAEHDGKSQSSASAKDQSAEAGKAKDGDAKASKGNQEEHKALVSDLLFDNLVVQR